MGYLPVELQNHSIAVKELVPIVVAIHRLSHLLSGKCVVIVSDNLSVVCAINAQSCRDPHLMSWVRRFFVLCTVHNIQVAAEHTPSAMNSCADAISRGLFARFRQLMPTASVQATEWSWGDFADLLQTMERRSGQVGEG